MFRSVVFYITLHRLGYFFPFAKFLPKKFDLIIWLKTFLALAHIWKPLQYRQNTTSLKKIYRFFFNLEKFLILQWKIELYD